MQSTRNQHLYTYICQVILQQYFSFRCTPVFIVFLISQHYCMFLPVVHCGAPLLWMRDTTANMIQYEQTWTENTPQTLHIKVKRLTAQKAANSTTSYKNMDCSPFPLLLPHLKTFSQWCSYTMYPELNDTMYYKTPAKFNTLEKIAQIWDILNITKCE